MSNIIQATRPEVSRTFPIPGFRIRTDVSPAWAEVVVATAPDLLFDPAARERRTRHNFYSSRSEQLLRIERGEVVYLLPPGIMNRFAGQPRLYYAVAVYRQPNLQDPQVTRLPPQAVPYINISSSFRGEPLGILGVPNPRGGLTGNGYANGDHSSLEWGGDTALPGEMVSVAAPGSTSARNGGNGLTARNGTNNGNNGGNDVVARNGNGVAARNGGNGSGNGATTAEQAGLAFNYDDGFDPSLWSQPQAYMLRSYAQSTPVARSLAIVRPNYMPTNPREAINTMRDFVERYDRWRAGVTNTRIFPHSAICQLRMAFSDGNYIGTGFYIGPDRILTCAHNVKDVSTNSEASSIRITPGKNGTAAPFGSFTVRRSDWEVHPRYDGTFNFDLAVIKVTTPPPNGLYFDTLEDLTQSIREPIIVCGYAAEQGDENKQNLDGDTIRGVSDSLELIQYNLQTEPGNSGSPVFYITGVEDPVQQMSIPVFSVIGVHISGFDESLNQACRLSQAKINWIRSVGRSSSSAQALSGSYTPRQRYPGNDQLRRNSHGNGTNQPHDMAMPAAFSADDIPLDPGTGGMSIAENMLARGDIILSTTSAPVSRAIRSFTDGPVSHALVYIGDGLVVEAIGEGVVNRSLSDAIGDATVAVAFRHPQLTDELAWRMRDWLGEQLGRAYDYWGIFQQARFRINSSVCNTLSGPARERCRNFMGRVYLGTRENDRFFCSELVLAAYREVGLPLTETPPHWASPSDIANLRLSHILDYVGHLKAPPLGATQAMRHWANAVHRTRAFAGESFDVNWNDVQLVPQLTGMSCWAAAAAMVVGWRDRISIDPGEVARGAGHWAEYATGLDPADVTSLANAWHLTIEPPQSYTIEGLRNLIEANGPIWVCEAVPSLHAVVVTGIYGDGTVNGTTVRIHDPWPVGQGTIYTRPFRQFVQDYEAAATNSNRVNIQILHAGLPWSGSMAQSHWTNGHRPNNGRPAAVRQSIYGHGLALSSFGGEAVELMRQEFVANAQQGSPRSCIVIANAGLRQLYGSMLQNADGSNKQLGPTIQGTMGALQRYGLADSPQEFEFNNASGSLTRGVVRPHALRRSVEQWLLDQAESNQMSAWYVFGLSIMDGYHSVVLVLQFSGMNNPDTRLYWLDQIYSGWDDVTGTLDNRITRLTQGWWDPLPQQYKARTRVTVWPLQIPIATSSGLAANSYDDIEGDEKEPVSVAHAFDRRASDIQACRDTCTDDFCPSNSATTAGTEHFTLEEFRCRDGTAVPEKFRGNVQRVMENLEILRAELGNSPITITSGYRTCSYNCTLSGSASQSRHLCGQAADIQVAGYTPEQVYCTIERLIRDGRMHNGGMGLYPNFVHYDVRADPIRWPRERIRNVRCDS
ncbi:MAG: trypsin-like peptidase domain-containing protein [Anaerolineae bacterium]|nr:trypsin-like peptidase domain-containing protein [Anaerolineae bacterium]